MKFEKEVRQRGIYKLDGDTLTLCIRDRDDDTRPSEFKSVEGTTLVTMTRVK